jgi:NAD(P)H-quinone oxidoreductase subunit 5
MSAVSIPVIICALSPLLVAAAILFKRPLKRPAASTVLITSWTAATILLAAHVGNLIADQTFLEVFGSRMLIVDTPSCLMLTLIGFISLITIKYSYNYLEGNGQQKLFICKLGLLTALIVLLATANNLYLMALSWCLTTPLLVTMLTQNKTKTAHVAAKRMLGHHLIADTCFLGALCLLANQDHDIATLNAHLLANPDQLSNYALVSSLLTMAALIKSAVFPLHSWLLGSLEAPTPLSAFLHAGVVNIAGFLGLRFAPLLTTPYLGGNMLIAFGLISAVLGAACSIVQPDVKRKLVYSTVAQMGFMCLQCGIGALHAALFHLIFHGCFKCYLFLSAGGAIASAKSQKHGPAGIGLARGLTTALLSMACCWVSLNNSPAIFLPATILTVSLIFEYLCLEVKQTPSRAQKLKPTATDLFLLTVLPCTVLIVAYAGGCDFFASYVVHGLESGMAGAILITFGCLMLAAWTAIRSRYKNAIKDWLYVLALNGGYLTRQ